RNDHNLQHQHWLKRHQMMIPFRFYQDASYGKGPKLLKKGKAPSGKIDVDKNLWHLLEHAPKGGANYLIWGSWGQAKWSHSFQSLSMGEKVLMEEVKIAGDKSEAGITSSLDSSQRGADRACAGDRGMVENSQTIALNRRRAADLNVTYPSIILQSAPPGDKEDRSEQRDHGVSRSEFLLWIVCAADAEEQHFSVEWKSKAFWCSAELEDLQHRDSG
ncbi:hypothetical protein DNTS_013546, partial [Danionella cerebrum]